jgi:hypothetical protein
MKLDVIQPYVPDTNLQPGRQCRTQKRRDSIAAQRRLKCRIQSFGDCALEKPCSLIPSLAICFGFGEVRLGASDSGGGLIGIEPPAARWLFFPCLRYAKAGLFLKRSSAHPRRAAGVESRPNLNLLRLSRRRRRTCGLPSLVMLLAGQDCFPQSHPAPAGFPAARQPRATG